MADVSSNRLGKILHHLSSNKPLSYNCILLNDGTVIPQIGLGTWKYRLGMKSDGLSDKSKPRSQEEILKDKQEDIEDYKEFAYALQYAIQDGYRHIDTAQIYRTEQVIGDIIKNISKYDKSLTRKDIFITTKVSRFYREQNEVRRSIEKSLNDLQLEYIDLFLIHSPHTLCKEGERGMDVINIYKILHEYKRKGKIRSVGVSNFGIKHLETLQRLKLPLPSVNQIEVSCFLYEKELIEYCKKKGIQIQAYSPIAKADKRVSSNKLLNELGLKYNKTWAQIMIKWLQQQGFIVLVKSTNFNRIRQNGDIFDFKITEDDMKKLNKLSQQNPIRVCWNPMKECYWDI